MKKVSRLIFAIFFAMFCARAAHAADVVILAKEAGYYTTLAKHAQRWLAQQKIASDFAMAPAMKDALAKSKVAILVGFDQTTENEMKNFANFRARGGRFIVFYSSSPQLANLMGVKPLGFVRAARPGQFSCMNFAGEFPKGMPRKILQTSSVLQRARPLPGRGRVLAMWHDRAGKSTDEPAWISTSAGYWMTHVLFADGDEALKARLLASMIGSLVPGSWSAAKADAEEAAAHRALRAVALQQIPRRGEIHAVWDHSGCGLYPGDWPRTMKVLREARVTDLFVNVAGAGFAHYASSILPRSRTFEQEGDQLSACLAAAQGTGIRVHAWVLCFSATRASSETLDKFRQRGWRLKTKEGALTEYLDPSQAAVQKYILSAIDEIQTRYRVQGIHLDFVRWSERSVLPKNAANYISSFVTAARQCVRRPAWLTTAVYGRYPKCIASVGQDWDSWLRMGVVDFVVPMDYCENLATFEELLRQHAENKTHAQRTIVGIGVTANESRLSAHDVIKQINLVRKYKLAGVSLFDLDRTLETQILPYLKLGMF